MAHALPEKLSILKTIRTKQKLAFHIETSVKVLLRPFHIRGEWFKCSKALALLALRAAEHGELECRACVAAEIERQRLEREDDGGLVTPQERELNRELAAFEAKHGYPSNPLAIHIVGMWERWPEYMREADPESDIFSL